MKLGHLSFTCINYDEMISFYKEILGFREKFVLYYDDIGRKVEGDKRWITYLEQEDGFLIELFNGIDAKRKQLPDQSTYNYQHFALVTEDIFRLKEYLIEKNVVIDRGPDLGIDQTWQMWSHDPDGNQIEFMQYTDKSFQLYGRAEENA